MDSMIHPNTPPGLARAISPLLFWIADFIRPFADEPNDISSMYAELAANLVKVVSGEDAIAELADEEYGGLYGGNDSFVDMIVDLADEFSMEPEAQEDMPDFSSGFERVPPHGRRFGGNGSRF